MRSLAMCLSTASPIGERQMFPRQTIRTLDDMFGLVCGEWDVSDHDQIILGWVGTGVQ